MSRPIPPDPFEKLSRRKRSRFKDAPGVDPERAGHLTNLAIVGAALLLLAAGAWLITRGIR